MKYKICKLKFLTGLHIGKGMLTDGEAIFMADTLFSALCHEAVCMPGGIHRLVNYCKQGKLKLSDSLPFIGETCYIPKPIITIESEKDWGNSKVKKAFKKLKYISIEQIDTYMEGNLDAQIEKEKLETFGKFELRQKASITYDEETTPYFIGSFHFQENNGLYVIIAYETEEIFEYISLLMECLSFSGIGGKRSAGYGKFQVEFCDLPEKLEQRLHISSYQKFISLSFSLPKESELENVCKNSKYQLIKRGGFVNSETYADTYQKKHEFYGFVSGSYFDSYYEGDIFDVAIHGRHPVYKYAIPIFMGVD